MELPSSRLVKFFLMIIVLLGLYVLCINRQIQAPWHMVVLDRFKPLSSAKDQANRSLEAYDAGNSLSVGTSVALEIPASPSSPSPKARPSQTAAPPGLGRSTQPTVTAPLKATKSSTPRPKPPKTSTTIPSTAAKTTPDFFGDSYASEDAPLNTSCPDGIRTKMALSSFAKRFLGRIPVLQWAKHATLAEYQRLRQYPGAHGWGGLEFPLLQASLSVLNTSANGVMFDDWEQRPNRSQCVRCAVVGNGGILKDSKKGLEIDQHDYVFRTNGAVIKGFEQDVGSRTSFYTFSTNTLRNSIHSYKGFGYNGPPLSEESRYVFLPDHDRDYILMRASVMHTPIERGPERTKTPPKYFGENARAEKFKMYHPDFIRYLRNRFLRSSVLKGKYRSIYRPSTGGVMLLAALHTCDQVSAYGFMTPDYKKYSNHYYDSKFQGVAFYANHDFRLEMSLWQELQQAGLLHLYMHQVDRTTVATATT
ncbi:alpha-N-acetylgalactosaminide alpha-2,6-sialyltransferase 2 [Clupea harengus]|uniref:alpha-N-acetylgalactosaminide alpha-2,6-sialyltransferase n=1 Tax=Clupea harengus TaxID=7950 RepID=A0A6P8EYW8_CLUHA|nr:alpha-N-acetylgalactosaminide alpha-2,6-sialyltransferase 2 [Clupea harengus]